MDGVMLLRERRGTQRIDFNDVADHMVDYADRHPEDCGAIERLARFLAEVEQVDHDHAVDPDRGVAGTPEREIPRV